VTFTNASRQMSLIDDHGKRVIEPGAFVVSAGPGKPSSQFRVTGSLTEVPELK